MSKVVTVRLPQTIIDFVEKIELSEDRTRTQVIIKLLEEAIEIRQFNSGEKDPEDQRMAELKEECMTTTLLKIAGHLSEILRYTFDAEQSKFAGAKSASDVRERIASDVDQYIKGYLKQAPK